MPFSDLIGNDLAKAALTRMVNQKKVPSTFLFCGPDGVGKGLFAQRFSSLLLGKPIPHPDLHIYHPEGKSGLHPVDNMRQMIDETHLPPYEAPAKIFIIQDADRMLPASSHALLKTFEEPSYNTHFILVSHSLEAILPTIVSRSRKVPFFPISQTLIESFIQTHWKKTEADARRIAFFSHGSLAKAKHLCQANQFPWRADLLDLFSLHLPFDYPQFQKLVQKIEEGCQVDEEASTQPQTDAILEEIVAWYRDLQLLKEGIAPEYLYHLDCLDRLKLALSLSVPQLEKVLSGVEIARLALQRHVKLRHVLEHLLLNI